MIEEDVDRMLIIVYNLLKVSTCNAHDTMYSDTLTLVCYSVYIYIYILGLILVPLGFPLNELTVKHTLYLQSLIFNCLCQHGFMWNYVSNLNLKRFQYFLFLNFFLNQTYEKENNCCRLLLLGVY